jgi:hypothetical protein
MSGKFSSLHCNCASGTSSRFYCESAGCRRARTGGALFVYSSLQSVSRRSRITQFERVSSAHQSVFLPRCDIALCGDSPDLS